MDEEGKVYVGFKVGDSIQELPEELYEEWLIYKKNLEKQRAKESQAKPLKSLKNQEQAEK